MFVYLTSPHEPLWHNATEYIYGHYLTLMTCIKSNGVRVAQSRHKLLIASFKLASK